MTRQLRRRDQADTCYLWDRRDELAELVEVWQAANRDDLFSVTSLKHFPYVANSVDIALTLYRNGSWAA